jgi:uncharacterized protein YbjQ (UPF0145 family)
MHEPGGKTVEISDKVKSAAGRTVTRPVVDSFACRQRDRDAGLLCTDRGELYLLDAGLMGTARSSSLTDTTVVRREGVQLTLNMNGSEREVVFYELADADAFVKVLRDRASALLPPEAVARSHVLVVTSDDIPGYDITEVHGDVYGITVRARNAFSNLGASLRTISGGEVAGYTKLLTAARNEAHDRLRDAARAVGANAVIAMRFDSSEIGDLMSEIVAYGTAVTAERRSPDEPTA